MTHEAAESEQQLLPFGEALIRLRAAAGLTQEQLAARAQLSRDAIAALESGKRRTPRAATIELLSAALGLAEQEHAALVAAARGARTTVGVRAGTLTNERGGDAGETTPRDWRRQPWWQAAQPTRLVGRTHEVETILQRYRDQRVRLLTLVGPAGVGKTRLALAAAAELAEQYPTLFPSGVVWVDLAPIRDSQDVLWAIGRALGFTDTGFPSLAERLEAFLQEQTLLLVLDNLEQVLPAAAGVLANLLATCPHLALLVTSRVPLRLRWEQTLRVAPLPIPDLREALPPSDALLAVPSVALFLEHARARRADFVLGEHHAPLVARLAVKLDGLPLALELAAARLDVLSLPALARRLDDRLRLLASAAPDRPERQQSLEAAIGWSYELLSEEEQRLFRCLGVFVGRVSLNAITAVVGEVSEARAVAGTGEARRSPETRMEERTLHGLLSLAEKSLVLPLPTQSGALEGQLGQFGQLENDDKLAQMEEGEDEELEPAFAMLETVREYAWEQLVAAGELEAAQRAHAHHFLALTERAAPELHGRGQRMWFFQLERELDNMRAALRWLLDVDEPAERAAGLRMAAALSRFWWTRGYHAEGRRWLEEALVRAPAGVRYEVDLAVRTHAMVMTGALLALRGDIARGRAMLREALTLAEQQQNSAGVAEALMEMGGECELVAGEVTEAMRLLREALRRWEALGDRFWCGGTLFYLGVATDATGDVLTATECFVAALQEFKAAGDEQHAGFAHCYLGVAEWKLGQLSSALEHIQAGVRTSIAFRDRFLLGFAAQAAVALVGARTEPAPRARLLGATDTLRQAAGTPDLWEREPGGQAMVEVRERLAQGEWAAAYREGCTLAFGDVAALAMSVLEEVARSLAVPERASQPGQVVRESAAQHVDLDRNTLSAREQEVLRLVAAGLSSKAVGQQLFLSPSTVNQHIKSIFNKLGVDTRAQAVAVASQRGLLELLKVDG